MNKVTVKKENISAEIKRLVQLKDDEMTMLNALLTMSINNDIEVEAVQEDAFIRLLIALVKVVNVEPVTLLSIEYSETIITTYTRGVGDNPLITSKLIDVWLSWTSKYSQPKYTAVIFTIQHDPRMVIAYREYTGLTENQQFASTINSEGYPHPPIHNNLFSSGYPGSQLAMSTDIALLNLTIAKTVAVHALLKEGNTHDIIAKRIGISTGEVTNIAGIGSFFLNEPIQCKTS